MEFLKIIFLASFIGLASLPVQAQDWDALGNAFTLSYQHEKNGDYIKAINEIKKVYDENSYEINLRLGWLNYNAGLFEESMANYQRAISLMPFSEEARFGMAYPASGAGKWEKVIEQYNEILKNSPGNTVALYRLGLIYYGRKDYNAALKYFKKVVDMYPFDYDGVIMLAWTNFQLGKTREAKVLFNKALINKPGDASAKEGLSYLK